MSWLVANTDFAVMWLARLIPSESCMLLLANLHLQAREFLTTFELATTALPMRIRLPVPVETQTD